MYVIIVLLLIGAVVCAWLYLFPKSADKVADAMVDRIIASAKIKPEELDTTEDEPVDFGFKQHWLAIKTTDTQKVADTLGAKQVYPCNWKKGIALAYRNATYITPPIDGWTLVVNSDLMVDEGRDNEKEIQKFNGLSKIFGEAQFFATHRVVEYHYWAKSVNGRLIRVYSSLPEKAEDTWIYGNPTEVEKSFNLPTVFPKEGEDYDAFWEKGGFTMPNEETVMQIAEAWSIDPTRISERTGIKGLGLVIV